MREGWRHTELGEHINLLTGYPFRSADYSTNGKEIRLLRGDNVVQGDIRWENARRWPSDLLDGLDRYHLSKGDVVVALDRTWVKAGLKAATVKSEDLPCLLVQRVARIRAKETLNQGFLEAIVKSHRFIEMVKSSKTETAVPHISPNDIREFVVDLPPLTEQRKIAKILRTWDEAVEKLEALRAAKRHWLTGLSQMILGRGGTFPDHWNLFPLSAISTRVRRQNGGGNHPVMTISAKSGFLMQSDKFSRDMAGRSVDRYVVLHGGEFAYNKGNSLTAPYGCIFPLDRPTALVPFVYFCFTLKNGLSRAFYAHLFAAGALNHQLSRLINSGVRNDGLLNLNVDDFFSCKVPVPPREEQEQIARVLTAAKDELRMLDKEIELVTRQKRGLTQKLLTGEWRVTIEIQKEAVE